MRLIANRQLCGSYGVVGPGQEFNVEDDTGLQLISNGVAYRPNPPRILYQTKVITPEAPMVGAGPFCDVPMCDSQPTEVAASGDTMFSVADVPKQGNVDSVKRRGRPRIHP